MVRLAALGAFAVLAVAVLAACGGGEGGEQAGADPKTWVGEVCTAVVAWRDDIQQSAEELGTSLGQGASAEELRGRLTDFLGGAVARTDELLADVEATGSPDVEQGEAISADLRSALGEVRQVLAEAEAEAEGLPTDDVTAFGQAAQELGTSIQSGIEDVATTFSDLSERYDSPELAEAFEQHESCSEIR